MFFEKIVPETEAGSRLDHYFKRHFKTVPHSLLSRLLRQKKIRLNGKKCTTSSLLAADDTLKLPLFLKEETVRPPSTAKISDKLLEEFAQNIIFENKYFIALNKPTGLAVQGGSGIFLSVDKLASQYLENHQQGPAYLVHRLDRETSGLLLIAKTLPVAKELTALFKERQIKKTYEALVIGLVKNSTGTIEHKLLKDANGQVDVCALNGKPALTHYQKRKEYQLRQADSVNEGSPLTVTHLILKPTTGRLHQLRVHTKAIGHPILGDRRYSNARESAKPYNISRLCLHASQLNFSCSFGDFALTSPIPDFLKGLISPEKSF